MEAGSGEKNKEEEKDWSRFWRQRSGGGLLTPHQNRGKFNRSEYKKIEKQFRKIKANQLKEASDQLMMTSPRRRDKHKPREERKTQQNSATHV